MSEATGLPWEVDRSNVSPVCAMSEASQEVSSPSVGVRSCIERPHQVSSVTSTV